MDYLMLTNRCRAVYYTNPKAQFHPSVTVVECNPPYRGYTPSTTPAHLNGEKK